LTQNFGEFLNLVEIVVIHVLGFVEDEHFFSSMGFLKSKLCNNLEEHIQVVVGMFFQHVYTLETFLYQRIFDEQFISGRRRRYMAST